MDMYIATDVGKVRYHNEDSCAIFEKDASYLLVVADGMGGHLAGEIASSMAVEYLQHAFQTIEEPLNKAEAKEWLKRTIENINLTILAQAKAEPQYSGMGTTLVVAFLTESYLLIANVGDSRAYIVTSNAIEQITHDHTLVAELLRNGEITDEEFATHPNKNILLQAVGTEHQIEVDIFEVHMRDVQGLMLCSDGLTTMLSDEDILHYIQEANTAHEAVDLLIYAANERGGFDNISVAMCLEKGDE
ncbi:Stp1/IreP family PP2C-type Ser/Thr phosphatase [Culicoidibacter larvae]|uniref:Stp1/IreP family PP2C-type Ser/Thr phosphatase n=1 Tax=Culicoidibacter larvae TaxID=2579976 RepID=A0A5R8QDJ2_9FIRM|nr:Stp1/IreP family PP2C-type Ser/Thr phosphatase [Culicoidibacter larvae]TLG75268.1 Stp1/IreP family PP2C-type Ser/Thr phosphatase [Culicoidibacter larvae]